VTPRKKITRLLWHGQAVASYQPRQKTTRSSTSH